MPRYRQTEAYWGPGFTKAEIEAALRTFKLRAFEVPDIERQAAQVERFRRLENRPIPATFDFAAVPQLRAEAREKLSRIRPTSVGQASRVSGITPADLAVLLFYLD